MGACREDVFDEVAFSCVAALDADATAATADGAAGDVHGSGDLLRNVISDPDAAAAAAAAAAAEEALTPHEAQVLWTALLSQEQQLNATLAAQSDDVYTLRAGARKLGQEMARLEKRLAKLVVAQVRYLC